ncbi:MAG: homoserine O-acetyltransferase [Chitinophagaceae bacterium]
MPETFVINEPFKLESGIELPRCHLAYTTYGKLNEKGDNVVWLFHALTANSNAEEWWPGLVGDGKLFDPASYFIVCVNMPGSCYGSIGPLDKMPAGWERGDAADSSWYHSFPFFTPRDMIRSYMPLRKQLGINKIKVGIGGSMGGQQLLEWAIEEPMLFEYIFPIATNAFHSPWAIAFNATQRLCIEADVSWPNDDPEAGMGGMKVARAVALISYRNYDTYQLGQSETSNEILDHFKSESYQRYQGEKLAKRFNAFSYYKLSQGMDAHNVGRGRGTVENALQHIKAKTLSIGIQTDILFPAREQQFIAEHIPQASFKLITSLFGHDGFLLEYEQIEKLIVSFIREGDIKNEVSESISYPRPSTDKFQIIT